MRDVRGRVIVAEDFQRVFLDASNGHVCQQWEEVTWSAARIFADQA